MFKLEFETDGAAFADGHEGRAEIATILNLLAVRIWKGSDTEGPIRDSNGNTIGRWSMDSTAD